MFRLPWHTPTQHRDENGELLHNLLQSPVPDKKDPLRPVVLRSTSEERRHILRSFRLFTWVDRALYRVERLLILVLLGFCLFWIADVYGRDWLHARQQRAQAMAALPATSITLVEVVAWNTRFSATFTDAAVEAGTGLSTVYTSTTEHEYRQASALPFILDDTADVPPASAVSGYMAPPAMSVPRMRVDPRPQRLIIPAIEVDTPVQEVFIEDGFWQVADYAAGYHHGTARPGDAGNMVMAGHAGLRGAVFRDLGNLETGDEVLVDTGAWRHRYRVRERLSVWPTQVELMEPTESPVLTLITCTAWDTRRLVVIADLVESRPL